MYKSYVVIKLHLKQLKHCFKASNQTSNESVSCLKLCAYIIIVNLFTTHIIKWNI